MSRVPLQFRGATEDDCRHAMESISKYLTIVSDKVKRENPDSWQDLLDGMWARLICSWADVYGHTPRLAEDGITWEISCASFKDSKFVN